MNEHAQAPFDSTPVDANHSEVTVSRTLKLSDYNSVTASVKLNCSRLLEPEHMVEAEDLVMDTLMRHKGQYGHLGQDPKPALMTARTRSNVQPMQQSQRAAQPPNPQGELTRDGYRKIPERWVVEIENSRGVWGDTPIGFGMFKDRTWRQITQEAEHSEDAKNWLEFVGKDPYTEPNGTPTPDRYRTANFKKAAKCRYCGKFGEFAQIQGAAPAPPPGQNSYEDFGASAQEVNDAAPF